MHLVGREGVSLIAVSGLDMAAWDALAKAAGLPLAVFLGGTVGRVVPDKPGLGIEWNEKAVAKFAQ